MPPWMMLLIHSYSKDIAGVVRMRVVNNGSSFLTKRGSSKLRVANYDLLAIAMMISNGCTD